MKQSNLTGLGLELVCLSIDFQTSVVKSHDQDWPEVEPRHPGLFIDLFNFLNNYIVVCLTFVVVCFCFGSWL